MAVAASATATAATVTAAAMAAGAGFNSAASISPMRFYAGPTTGAAAVYETMQTVTDGEAEENVSADQSKDMHAGKGRIEGESSIPPGESERTDGDKSVPTFIAPYLRGKIHT